MSVQEADGDCLYAFGSQRLRQPPCLPLIEGLKNGSIGHDTLVELEAQSPRNKRRRLVPEVVVVVGRPHST